MIVIVDYAVGNLGSIQNMLKRIGVTSQISSDPREIMAAEKLIFPGVGAFDHGIKKLEELGLVDVLHDVVKVKRKPTLGICLGAQLMTQGSEEGDRKGLGWLRARVVRFKFAESEVLKKIPHMGWNEVRVCKESSLFAGMDEESRFYFVHSFHFEADRESEVLAKSSYGYEFASALQRENVTALQFHPEKSHKYGMKLLSNFVRSF